MGSNPLDSKGSVNCNSSVDMYDMRESIDSDRFKPVYEASDTSAEESPKKLLLEPVIYSRKKRTVATSMRSDMTKQVCSRY